MGLKINILATFVAILGYFLFDVIKVIYKETIFNNEAPSDFESCERVKEIKGCANVVIHGPSSYAFFGCPEDFSTYKNFISFFYNPRDKIILGKKSNVFVYNVQNKQVEKLKIKGYPKDADLFIHGSSVITDPKDKNKLHYFTVNHRAKGKDTVEHFTYKIGSKDLNYVETFESDELKLASNIAAVSPSSFYYTQDLSHKSGMMNYLESLGLIEGGKVMFRSESGEYVEMARGFKLTNGLTLSKDQTQLYLAESFRGNVHVFNRNIKTNKLQLVDTISINFSPIGLNTDTENGDIYIAGIPIDLSIIDSWGSYGSYKSKLTKSIVAKIALNGTSSSNGKYEVEPILFDDGSYLSSTTSVAKDSSTGSLLITGIFNYKGLLDCRL